jgi:hypothetical protein
VWRGITPQNIQRAGDASFANQTTAAKTIGKAGPTAQSRRDDQLALHASARVPSIT